MHRERLLPVRCAQAIRPRVAAADDDHALAGGQNLPAAGTASPSHALVLLRQEIHREMDALQLAAGHLQIARLLRAAGQQDGIELAPQIVHRHVARRRARWSRNFTPSAAICSMRRSMRCFSILKFGMP